MSIEYTNHKDETYHVHEGTGRKGETRYFFSKKKKGASVESIPEGYEIYEAPNLLDGSKDLRKLAKTYCLYLDRDSLYELL